MSLVGRHIGRYRILEQLGQGGMSVVYKGLDTALDREVAVKVLHSHLASKEESRRRLAREAKAVARLNHPNILEVYDFAGADAEQAYIVTEYIRGQTLRQYAETTGFEPPEIAAMVVHEIAAALAQAHEAGVIHRDLKPENVMVRDDGIIKLMDFGIAKIIDRDDKMTMTGALVGSPAHMAPEIIEGEEAGAEADVFSLGTMLFYFATGRLPFTAPNTTATLKKILDGIYDDPRQLVPTVSDDLAEIIATCLARQPSSRYPNAVKLRDALHEYLTPLGLGRTTEELASFFADPPSYRKALVPRLGEALVKRAEALVAEKRPAKALSALNQILALDPNNGRAAELLQQMNVARKRQRANRAWLRAGIAAGVIAALAVPVYFAARALTRPADFVPQTDPLQEVVLPAQVFAAAPDQGPEVVPGPSAQEDPRKVEPSPPPNPVTAPRNTGERPVAKEKGEPKLAAVTRPAVAKVPVTFKFRPYGYLEIAGAARTQERPLHALELPPGAHKVIYGCRFCQQREETITVAAGQPNEFHLPVEALPSKLRFNFQPGGAHIRVRGEQRTAAESLSRPFDIRMPKGSSELRHHVEYEVFFPGYKPMKDTVTLVPGETRTVAGALTPE